VLIIIIIIIIIIKRRCVMLRNALYKFKTYLLTYSAYLTIVHFSAAVQD